MMINDENKKSIKTMLGGRALYIALGVCLLAAGAVGISAMNTSTIPLSTESTTGEKTTYKNVNDPVFHEKVPEVKVSEPVSQAQPVSEVPSAPVTEPPAAEVFDNDSETLEEKTSEAAEAGEIRFSLPVNGKLCKDYSMGLPVFSDTMADYRTHNGVDITCEPGGQIKAAAPGKVTAVLCDTVWGNSIEIDHGSGYVSRISGLADEGILPEGSSVEADTVIGVVGTIPVEAKEESHIHFEIRKNGDLIDPLEALGFTETDD